MAIMEAESIKRSSSVKITKASPSVAAIVEGTSVTPRQRPKGQSVGTGPISLSGQIVGQISGQGNSLLPQNSVSYVHVNPQISGVAAITPNPQPSLQLSMQSTTAFSSTAQTNVTSPNQPTVATVAPPTPVFTPTTQSGTSPFGQSQSPLISHSPLTQQSPVTVQEKAAAFYFDSTTPTTIVVPAVAVASSSVPGSDDHLEALFPVSGKTTWIEQNLDKLRFKY